CRISSTSQPVRRLFHMLFRLPSFPYSLMPTSRARRRRILSAARAGPAGSTSPSSAAQLVLVAGAAGAERSAAAEWSRPALQFNTVDAKQAAASRPWAHLCRLGPDERQHTISPPT